jgi:hypothetical protein
MKYAITGPRGAIFNIVDVEPTDGSLYSEMKLVKIDSLSLMVF